MRAVDTNVVARYLTNDDASQAVRARLLVEREDGLLPLTVLLETEWALRAVFGFAAPRVIAGLRGFVGLEHVVVENAATAAIALDWAERGLDFADAFQLAAARSHDGFISFDKRLARARTRLPRRRFWNPDSVSVHGIGFRYEKGLGLPRGPWSDKRCRSVAVAVAQQLQQQHEQVDEVEI